jgi:hypothetical protein
MQEVVKTPPIEISMGEHDSVRADPFMVRKNLKIYVSQA